ncbi:MAG: sigma-70 family RNA polymerase sigma factor [Planctomycetes bacterium]|nr:sigma-70 family RNA polymerase sigma factor [Planctomycetota bacterium]
MHATDRPPAPVSAPWVADARRRVHRYLRCLRCRDAAAEDLTQEALLAALRTFGGTAEPPLPWLFKTARNLWLQALRRQHREELVGELDRLHNRAVAELGDDGGDARVAALRECLATLPPRSRLAVQLRYRDGMTRAAVAERIGLSDDGCKNLFERVRNALRTCMERSLGR